MEVRCFWNDTHFVTTFDDLPQMVINLEGMTSIKSHFADGRYCIDVCMLSTMQTYHYKDKEVWEFILEKFRLALFVIMFPHGPKAEFKRKPETGNYLNTAVAPNEDQ